jgi:hypothetical protein
VRPSRTRDRHRAGAARPLLVATLLAAVAGCTAPPADDPASALRAVCGEDAEIVEQDVHPLDEDPSWQEPPLECEVDGHRVEAYALRLSDGGLASEINSEQDVFFSGNGGALGWATSEDVDDTQGILVEIFPLNDGEADTDLLDPLEDDGWETGLGYTED